MRIIQLTSYPNPNELGLGNTNETYIRIESSLNVSDIFPPDIDVQIEDTNTHKKYFVKAKEGNEFRINKLGQLYRDYNVNPGDEIKFTYIEIQDQKTVFFTVKNYKRVFLKVGSKGTEIVNMDNIAPFMVDEEKQEYSIKIDEGVLLLKFLKSDKKRVDSPNETNYFSSHVNNVQLSDGDYFITLNDDRNILEVVKKNVVEEYTLLEDSLYKIPNQSSNKLPHQQIYYGDLTTFDKNLLTAIRTKPFLLLAGISGTGKSRIVKQMAFESCPNIDQLRSDKTSPGNYQLIEVKPNWHDSTEVLGYESAITNKYIVTPFVKFLVKAMCHPDVPFFVCMDEMNLAPVEQYFAEFLSVLESRKLVNGTITSEPLIKADVFQKYGFGNENIFDLLGLKRVPCSLSEIESVMLGGSSATSEYFEREDIVDKLKREGLRIPSNLIVVGTVNMDETTHQFSRKVIDRAMTIEMNIADSEEPFNNFFAGSNELDYLDTPSRKELFLPTVVQANEALDRLSEEDKEYLVKEIPTLLHSLNSALNGTPFKIAYRVQNELVLYFYELRREEKNVSAEELLARAMDAILMLKVLPRIEGDEELLEKPLEELAKFTANYKQAHAKVEEMQSRLNAHFTSFWP